MRTWRWWLHPARVAPWCYVLGWGGGTVLLMLPAAARDGRGTGFWEAGFTSMSALCITGLAVVDTRTHWSTFGQLVVLGLVQVGGFGIVTLTCLILFRIGDQSLAQARMVTAEAKSRTLAGVRSLPGRILTVMLISEALLAVVLTIRFRSYHPNWETAAYHGIFHAVSGYNNAGFALYSDNLMGFGDDPWIILPLCAAVIAGGLGFPIYTD